MKINLQSSARVAEIKTRCESYLKKLERGSYELAHELGLQ